MTCGQKRRSWVSRCSTQSTDYLSGIGRELYGKGTGAGTAPLRQPNFDRLISLNRDREKISIARAIRLLDLLPRDGLEEGYGIRSMPTTRKNLTYGCWIWQSSRSGFIGAGVSLGKGGV